MVIGITGSFGTGKSYVSSIFRRLGARVIDADKLAHKALRKGSPSSKKVVNAFGMPILNKDGGINRKALAGIVFNNKVSLGRLNEIIHPAVIKEIKEIISKVSNEEVMVIDAPLLIEANLIGMVDKLIVVKASLENQVSRCKEKFCLEKEEVMKRVRMQIPIKRKMKMADFVIDNNGSRRETEKQVERIWRDLWR